MHDSTRNRNREENMWVFFEDVDKECGDKGDNNPNHQNHRLQKKRYTNKLFSESFFTKQACPSTFVSLVLGGFAYMKN